MSENHPPAGTPEYLEYGGGEPLSPAAPPSGGGSGGSGSRRGRRAWWIGAGAVAVLGVGAGAWAAVAFFEQGAQPAEALPASTIAYVSIDLDPSGGQKIDAFRTLNKFPAFKDEVGVNSVDDIRRKVGESLLEDTGCTDLSYDHDIEPWLGDRAAFALVDLPGAEPDSIVVVQVADEDKARDAITALNSCNTEEDPVGFVVRSGWAVVADDQELADDTVAATEDGSLADDATYQKWTKAVGEAGVVNAYASPSAGHYLAQRLERIPDIFGPDLESQVVTPDDAGDMTFEPGSTPSISSSGFQATAGDEDPVTRAFSEFRGGAATLRFTGDGLELSIAGDGSAPEFRDLTGSTGGQLVQRLPDDTAAAAAITLQPGWLDRRFDSVAQVFGSAISREDAYRELSRETGLDVPDDVETLLGSGVAVGISRDLDFEAAENSDDGSGLPMGAVVKGDPAAIEAVLDKLRVTTGNLAFLGSDHADDLEAIGPSEEYRKDLLTGGHLGDDDTFQSVVPDAGDASSVFYVNIDAFEPSIRKAAAGDQDILDNVTPLQAIGMSAWDKDDVIRFSLQVSTN